MRVQRTKKLSAGTYHFTVTADVTVNDGSVNIKVEYYESSLLAELHMESKVAAADWGSISIPQTGLGIDVHAGSR